MGIKQIILILLFICLNSDTTEDYKNKAINSCGIKGYTMPEDKSKCVEEKEICCFVRLNYTDSKTGQKTEKRFCASAPSNIKKEDIQEEIEKYTDYELAELVCNNSIYFKISFIFLMIYILLF